MFAYTPPSYSNFSKQSSSYFAIAGGRMAQAHHKRMVCDLNRSIAYNMSIVTHTYHRYKSDQLPGVRKHQWSHHFVRSISTPFDRQFSRSHPYIYTQISQLSHFPYISDAGLAKNLPCGLHWLCPLRIPPTGLRYKKKITHNTDETCVVMKTFVLISYGNHR